MCFGAAPLVGLDSSSMRLEKPARTPAPPAPPASSRDFWSAEAGLAKALGLWETIGARWIDSQIGTSAFLASCMRRFSMLLAMLALSGRPRTGVEAGREMEMLVGLDPFFEEDRQSASNCRWRSKTSRGVMVLWKGWEWKRRLVLCLRSAISSVSSSSDATRAGSDCVCTNPRPPLVESSSRVEQQPPGPAAFLAAAASPSADDR